MHCDILDSFYLKPNGDVPCEDDIGEAILLGRVPNLGEWSPSEFFEGERYRKLRDAAEGGWLPWGETCRQCAHLQPRHWGSRLLRRRIRKFQIEPTMLCALRCPACGNREQLKTRKGDRHLPLEMLERVLRGFSKEGYRIDYVEWAGQGDPLMHPDFAELSKLLRRYYPNTLQRIITNGNYDFREALGDAFVEDIVVSCDGAIQENYEKYRVRGDVDSAFRFMADAKRYSPGTKIIWKYVLFEYNDTDEEIVLAQELAMDFGVDEMRFVVTGTDHRSERFHLGNSHELPVIHPNLSVRLNPLMSRIETMFVNQATGVGALIQAIGKLPRVYSKFGRVFTTVHWKRRYFVVEAWIFAARRQAAEGWELRIDGERRVGQLHAVRVGGRLANAAAALGVYGYEVRFSCVLPEPLGPDVRLELVEVRLEGESRVAEGRFRAAVPVPAREDAIREPVGAGAR